MESSSRNSALTVPRPGFSNSIVPALSQTMYSSPMVLSTISIQNGSVIANRLPPKWVPT